MFEEITLTIIFFCFYLQLGGGGGGAVRRLQTDCTLVKNGKVNKKIKQKSPIGSGWKGESLQGNELS